MADVSLIDRLLDVIEHDIVPKTAEGVAHGNKLFGAAILRKGDRSLVVAETNNEIENPLWHGEMHCLKRLYEMPQADRPRRGDCIFLATHEPCSLCLSAITWAGFDNFYYLFSHEDSRDSFAIPHDLKILKEVFTLDPGGYHAENAYWKSYSHPQAGARPAGDRARAARSADRQDRDALRRTVGAYQAGKTGQRHSAELRHCAESCRSRNALDRSAVRAVADVGPHEDRHRISPQGRSNFPTWASRCPTAAGCRRGSGCRTTPSRIRCRRSSNTCPTASATARRRATPDASLLRRPRLCLRPRRHARQRRFRRPDGGRIHRAGTAGRLRGDRLGGRAALVHRRGRHDGHFLGRLQRAAGRGEAPAGAEGGDHALLDRRPLRRRHPLQGRLLLNENLGWAATMLAYSSRPPDPAIVGDSWRDMWLERLENEPFLPAVWLEHQRRDAFWKHGSICEDFSAIKAAMLAVGGWADGYKNAVSRLVAGIEAPAKGIVGPWIHKYPHFAVPKPAIGFLQEALRWWDRWLKDIDTGVENDPAMRLYVMDSEPPRDWYEERPGRWIAEHGLAVAGPRTAPIHARRRRPARRETRAHARPRSSPRRRIAAWPAANIAPSGSARNCRATSAPTTRNRLLRHRRRSTRRSTSSARRWSGCRLAADRPQAMLAVRLCDVQPDGALDPHHLWRAQPDAPRQPRIPRRRWCRAKPMQVALQLDDIAYRVPAGHRLRLAISTTYWPMVWPSPEPVSLTLSGGDADLPLRPRAQATKASFAEPEGARAWATETVRHASHKRATVERDRETGTGDLRYRRRFRRRSRPRSRPRQWRHRARNLVDRS